MIDAPARTIPITDTCKQAGHIKAHAKPSRIRVLPKYSKPFIMSISSLLMILLYYHISILSRGINRCLTPNTLDRQLLAYHVCLTKPVIDSRVVLSPHPTFVLFRIHKHCVILDIFKREQRRKLIRHGIKFIIP